MLDDTLPIFLFVTVALVIAAALPAVVRLAVGGRAPADEPSSATGIDRQFAQSHARRNAEARHVRFAVELIVLHVLAVFLFLWAVAAEVGNDTAGGSSDPSDATAFWTLVVLMTLPMVGIGFGRLNGLGRRLARGEPASDA